ncbi:prolyl oligopeptidase family serine peptidase [soil metagenome]
MIDTRTVDVIEDYHGTEVADPYRWLEEDTDETAGWVQAQNRLTQEFLSRVGEREAIRDRLTELWNFPRHSIPIKAGNRYFFSRNDGLQNQSVYCVRDGLDGDARVLIDPNTSSEDGTVALSNATPSRDGKWLAYATSEAGSDWQTIKIRNVETGDDLKETIQWAKFHEIAWHPDGSGFYYNRLPDPGTVPPEDQNLYSRICWHALGADPNSDPIIYERPEFKELRFVPHVTVDGRYLVLTASVGTDPETRIYYRPLESDGDFVRLLDDADAEYLFVDNDDETLLVFTTFDAPRGRVVAIDLNTPERQNWREVVGQLDDGTIEYLLAAGDQLVAVARRNARQQVLVCSRNGQPVGEIEPAADDIFSLDAIWGKPGEDELFVAFSSFLRPSMPYRVALPDTAVEPLATPAVDFDAEAYVTRQITATSKDGTRVPLFVAHRKDLAMDGSAPALLHAYGGFNVSMGPHFDVSPMLWLERGGVYALGILRGGGEFGDEWHRAGMLEKKQNVFDDFIACGEHLIAEGYTSREKLVINGRSNGGLLVAACLTQRPDLYGAVVCEVPVIDMLRFHRWSAGHFWTGEYGNAEENADHFRFMYAYSPLHNLKPGTHYPPTLITTADTDDRVVPGHARKFTGALQAAQGGDAPVLLRIETRAGHGHGKPVAKQIAEATDILAFLDAALPE